MIVEQVTDDYRNRRTLIDMLKEISIEDMQKIVDANEKVYFFEPLEKEISIEDMQKIVDANEKLVKELKDAKD